MAENTQPQALTPDEVIAQLKADLAAKDQIIAGQAEQLQASEVQSAGTAPVVTHDKKKYRVVAPKFQHKGQEVKADELKGNKALVAELVKSGSGVLQLVADTKADEAPAAE